jgi:hypothetical protein
MTHRIFQNIPEYSDRIFQFSPSSSGSASYAVQRNGTALMGLNALLRCTGGLIRNTIALIQGVFAGKITMNPHDVCEDRRRKPQPIEALVAQPAFLFAFQTSLKQLRAVFSSRFQFRFERNPLSAMPIMIGRVNRLLLTAKGRLCTMLAQRLLTAPCHFGVHHLALGSCALSRLHAFEQSSATCGAILQGTRTVNSVAFHPTAPVLATGSDDKSAKLWRLSSDNSSATCVATLEGHSDIVTFVTFHPSALLLAATTSAPNLNSSLILFLPRLPTEILHCVMSILCPKSQTISTSVSCWRLVHCHFWTISPVLNCPSIAIT